MTWSRRRLMSAGLLVLTSWSAYAGDVKVIANPSVKADSVTSAELRGIFLLQRRTLKDGSPVVPVLRKSGDTHETFLRQYLDRGSEEIVTYYQGLVFTGKGSMPKQFDSDAEMLAFVARTRGAIGYVSSSSSTDGVKMLTISSGDMPSPRVLLTRVEPEYPETLKRMGIGGTVRLELVISPKRTVESVSVRGGNPILGESAVRAARQWTYAVAPTQTTIEVTIPFAP